MPCLTIGWSLSESYVLVLFMEFVVVLDFVVLVVFHCMVFSCQAGGGHLHVALV